MTGWEDIGLVVGTSPAGEIDAIVTVILGTRGLQRGFVRAGRARRSRSVWEVGNRVWLRWRARDAEPFGIISGEAIDQPLSRIVDDGRSLTALLSACATIRDALPLGGEAPLSFAGLCAMIEAIGTAEPGSILARLVRWELDLLVELGYGLDLSRADGTAAEAILVSPRTGRAVTASEAGDWYDRLMPLPLFLQNDGDLTDPNAVEIEQGLQLTGHFLSRELFAHREGVLPPERQRLLTVVERLARKCREAPASAPACDR